jgi:hypothetical protein
MIYKFSQPQTGEEVKVENFPNLSAVDQEENHGIVADISEAIKANETLDEAGKQSCILPRTNFEYLKTKQVKDLKILKDVSPQITVKDTTTSLLASSMIMECRFKAFD